MVPTFISAGEFGEVALPVVGLPVSLPWKGCGSAIFLELGALAAAQRPQHHERGEACIAVEWDWRVESESAVLFGSSSSGPRVEAGLCSLLGARIEAIAVEGRVPELVVNFSNGRCLRSMVMLSGDPEWAIHLPDGGSVRVRNNQLVRGGPEPPHEDEVVLQAAIANARQTAGRWGRPIVEPRGGSCADCASFVRIDGEFDLLDYGCCSAQASPFDGRVVNKWSGCPAFVADSREQA
jgi:hypothetical protein